jgi:hypothetical protein
MLPGPMDEARLAERASRQGLTKVVKQDPAALLTKIGWVPSAGGALACMTMWRRAGIGPKQIGKALQDQSIAEVVTVRRTAMLVPASDVTIALALGAATFDRDVLMPLNKTAKLARRELMDLEAPILRALERKALTSSQIATAIGAKSKIRDLGVPGRAKALATTLAVALAWLEGRGLVARRIEDGAIVSGVHLYEKSDRHKALATTHEAAALDALTERFGAWHGTIDPAHLAAFAGIGVKLARDLAVKAKSPKKLRGSAVPAQLLPFRDPFTALLTPTDLTRHASAIALSWSNEKRPLGELPTLHQHTVHVGGEVVGLWEWDEEKGRVVWDVLRTASGTPAAKLPRATAQAIDADAEKVGAFVKSELGGELRYYALDGDTSREERLAFVRRK